MKITELDENRDITSTGWIIQRKSKQGSNPPGLAWRPKVVECSGRRMVRVGDKMENFARALWVAFKGPIPQGFQVDHINGDPSDDRLENLRLLSHADNNRACHKPKTQRASKYRGVFKNSGNGKKWKAGVRTNGKYIHAGYFDCEIEAAKARDAKAIELGWPKEGLNFS